MAEIREYSILFLIWLASTIIVRAFITFMRSKPIRSNSSQKSNKQLPPSPALSLPILGHLHLLSPIAHQALAKLSSRSGPLIHIYLGSVPCAVVSSSQMAKEFLKTHESCFLDRPSKQATDYLTYGTQDFTCAPYGPFWKFMKKLCMSELLGGQTLDLLQNVRRQEIITLVDFLSKLTNGSSVEIGAELTRQSNSVISRMLMSKRSSEDENQVWKLIHEISEIAGKFNLSDYVWFCKNLDVQGIRKRLKEIRGRFDDMMEKIIDDHQTVRRQIEKNGETNHVKDLLDILLDISEDYGSSGSETMMKLTKENIKAFIMDLFAAGTESSAITTEWALSELINHPNILKKAAEEIDSVVGNKRLVEESDIPNLPYLQAIVKETLRLHPAAPIVARQSNKESTIAGYTIPAKTALFVNVWAIGRDPKHWENALEFMPERFLNEQLDVRGQHYHFLPFGSGRRGCAGTSLAMLVVQATLAAMIQCFDWKVEGGGTVDMEEGPALTLPRAYPLVCLPVPRLTPIPLSDY